MKCEVATILSNEEIAKDTYRMEMQAEIAADMQPGQFVNIQIDSFFLRRPISICDVIDPQHFVIIYKVVGDGTKRLSLMDKGQTLNVFGPLGHGYPIEEKEDSILLIGGGVGVPPLYELAKQYRRLDKKVDVVLGFNDRGSLFYEEEFKALGCRVYVATMDGSYGTKGTVMDAIDEKYDAMDDFRLVDELSVLSKTAVPKAVEELRTAPVLHDTVVEKDEMKAIVKKILNF